MALLPHATHATGGLRTQAPYIPGSSPLAPTHVRGEGKGAPRERDETPREEAARPTGRGTRRRGPAGPASQPGGARDERAPGLGGRGEGRGAGCSGEHVLNTRTG